MRCSNWPREDDGSKLSAHYSYCCRPCGLNNICGLPSSVDHTSNLSKTTGSFADKNIIKINMTRKMTYSQGNEVLKSREVESVTYYAQLVSAYLCMTVIGVQLDPS